MNLQDRISAFAALGTAISNFRESELELIYHKALSHNTWFTKDNVKSALKGVERYLQKDKLEEWINRYNIEERSLKTIGIVMAGNIPLVGFHDFLSVLIAGHKVKIKVSHQDPFLLPYLVTILTEIAPAFKNRIEFADKLSSIDAIIATGSDNSSRYFKYYFSKYPHIIRQNRTSVAVLNGQETKEELFKLGKDIFQYYGLGCRNVSKLFIPEAYDFTPLFEAIAPYESVRDNHKFVNNYDYNKSIYLINQVPHQDNGFLLLTPSEQLVSPISVLFFEHYTSEASLRHSMEQVESKIQCIVSQDGSFPGSILFGKAQEPELEDYADGVDTMKFLERV